MNRARAAAEKLRAEWGDRANVTIKPGGKVEIRPAARRHTVPSYYNERLADRPPRKT